ncbi:MAG: hypothetical protein WCO54_06110, partial [Bacteroidota bacterium]
TSRSESNKKEKPPETDGFFCAPLIYKNCSHNELVEYGIIRKLNVYGIGNITDTDKLKCNTLTN